ncbi:hypothetical protein CB1_001408018 [Camelus ferus]|nr:hypothetical protein CB1_001408018 [Camelus ferus]
MRAGYASFECGEKLAAPSSVQQQRGVEVQTDYVPLLNSLAAYGWQLTCVLPTPVVKTTREGNISTKQVVFLQRPCLPQKIKKESKFQWRFSREEMRNRQSRKSRGKRGARDKQQTEEKEKNLEDQFPKAGDMGNHLPGLQQEDWASQEKVTGEKLCPDGQLCVDGGAVQNGPSGHSPSPAGGGAGRSSPDPGEGAREGGAEEAAAEDN